MESCDLFIVGAGAAGLSAARAAAEQGCKSILLADRMPEPGGILRRCIHDGFGAEQTGPEYIHELMAGFPKNISFLWNTSVLSVDENRSAVLSSPEYGFKKIHFKHMILASGCSEIPMGSLDIAGTRPKGIYTAGELQQDMNLRGMMPEGPAVVLGSGDVGLIVAWQLIKSGVEIKALVEKKDACAGLARNRRRLEEYKLPIQKETTVSRVFGEEHLEGVNIRNLRTGEETYIPCRTLVIAAGLRTDRSLVQNLEPQPWLQLCGNCRRIHSVVEGVVQEGRQVGIAACEKLREET